ncbi:FAD-dependent oxidoreductase [Streptomyces sp. KL116D]|uniref:FAD-dependent oxidoreductase n=1 Tax=Streptomyces sp. KL116D TaxID=3045152 RepID=UPI0035580765
MPSKALLRPVLARADARRLPGLRQAVQGPLDTPRRTLAHRDDFTSHWKDDGQVGWIESIGVDLYRGHGRLAGPRTVTVTADDGTVTTLTARHAVAVCTGTRAALPPLPGLADVAPWTSREATSAEQAPGRLIVVGGGVVATEMATAWQALGSQVTMLVRGGGLLNRMEPFAGELVTDALREAGADVRTGVSVTAVERKGGTVTATLGDGSTVEADEILFATGRAPRTDDIGLETVGLEPGLVAPGRRLLRVEGSDWLYAVGDANHRALLTHQGKYQARIAGAAITARAQGVPLLETDRWGRARRHRRPRRRAPGRLHRPGGGERGPDLAEAEAAGHRVRAVDYDLANVAGASLYAEGYTGRARMVVDLDRRSSPASPSSAPASAN